MHAPHRRVCVLSFPFSILPRETAQLLDKYTGNIAYGFVDDAAHRACRCAPPWTTPVDSKLPTRVAHRTALRPQAPQAQAANLRYTAKKQGGCSDRLIWGYDRFAAWADSLQLPTARSCAHQDSQPPQPRTKMPLLTYFTPHRRNRSALLGNRLEFLIWGYPDLAVEGGSQLAFFDESGQC